MSPRTSHVGYEREKKERKKGKKGVIDYYLSIPRFAYVWEILNDHLMSRWIKDSTGGIGYRSLVVLRSQTVCLFYSYL